MGGSEDHEFSKIPTIPAEIRTTPFPICSVLRVVNRATASTKPDPPTVCQSELIQQEGQSMEAIGLLVTLEARAGKEADAEAFLKSAQPLALDEKGP